LRIVRENRVLISRLHHIKTPAAGIGLLAAWTGVRPWRNGRLTPVQPVAIDGGPPESRPSRYTVRRRREHMATAQTFIGRKRVRKFFGKIQEVAEMPNLIEVQKASYDQFLQIAEPQGGRPDEGL